jgi:hypothetical protein
LRNRQSVIEQFEQSVNEIGVEKKRQFDIKRLEFSIVAGRSELENDESEIEQNFVSSNSKGLSRVDSNVL